MQTTDIMIHSDVVLRPDPSRTVIRPFTVGDPEPYVVEGHPRDLRIVERVLALPAEELATTLHYAIASLSSRHRNVEQVLRRRFEELPKTMTASANNDQALLIGAYFSEEYSFEAAALFNPSMVLHPDQRGAPDDGFRFLMSLRGIGEGHVSSVAFRTGTWGASREIQLDPPSPWAVAPRVEMQTGEGEDAIVHLHCDKSQTLSETVLFPILPSQRQGIEDLRLLHFTDDDGVASYYGTYTAFAGDRVRQELIYTKKFGSFDMSALLGPIAASKGMAIFPRRISGRYAALGRQDNENLRLLYSDDMRHWSGNELVLGPRYSWEFIQIGNCGAPIEIDEGWLVLTHGVGSVRNYCIGACLLDKNDPSRVLGRTPRPLLTPEHIARVGYVPNVVYSCGAMVHERMLLLPYGVADSFTTFAKASLDDVLAAME